MLFQNLRTWLAILLFSYRLSLLNASKVLIENLKTKIAVNFIYSIFEK
jgi:hypothetical protein